MKRALRILVLSVPCTVFPTKPSLKSWEVRTGRFLFFFSFLFWMKHGGHLMRHVHVNIRIHVYTYMGTRLLHGKRWRTKEHMKVPTEGVDGEGLTGGHQGYMDFLFWGILCCKFFSFFSFFCTPRNTKTERLSKRKRKRKRDGVTLPNTVEVKASSFP